MSNKPQIEVTFSEGGLFLSAYYDGTPNDLLRHLFNPHNWYVENQKAFTRLEDISLGGHGMGTLKFIHSVKFVGEDTWGPLSGCVYDSQLRGFSCVSDADDFYRGP